MADKENAANEAPQGADVTTAAKPTEPMPSPAAVPMDEETLMMLNGGVMPSGADGGETMQQRFARFKRERQRERKLAKFVAKKAASVPR